MKTIFPPYTCLFFFIFLLYGNTFAQKVYERNEAGRNVKYFQVNKPKLAPIRKITAVAPNTTTNSNTKVISQAKSADGKANIKFVKGTNGGSYNSYASSPRQIPNEVACYHQDIVVDVNSDESTFLLNPVKTNIIYPGSVIDGNSIASGGFTKIQKAQKPIVIWTENLNFPNPAKAIVTVDNPTAPYVNSTISQITQMHTGVQAANVIFRMQEIKSKEEVSLALGGHYSDLLNEVNALFTFDQSTTTHTFLLEYTQVYFTAFADVPADPANFFAEATPSIPENWMYISDVTYGRRGVLAIRVKEKTEKTGVSTSYDYNGLVTSGGADLSSSLSSLNNEVSVRGWIKGGNPVAAASINTANWRDNIKRFFQAFQTGAKFDQNNPAVPLAYTLRFINDHEIGRLEQTLKYARQVCDNSIRFRVEVKRFECIYADDGSNSEEELYGRIGIRATGGVKFLDGISKQEIAISGLNVDPFPIIWETPYGGAYILVRSGRKVPVTGSPKIIQVPFQSINTASLSFVTDGKTPSGGQRGIMENDPNSSDEIYTAGVISAYLLKNAYHSPVEVKQRFTQGSSKLDVVYSITRDQ